MATNDLGSGASTGTGPMIVSGQRILKGHRGPKSKAGCRACKGRRIKCGEEKPTCQNCTTKSLDCIYAPPRVAVHRTAARSVSSSETKADGQPSQRTLDTPVQDSRTVSGRGNGYHSSEVVQSVPLAASNYSLAGYPMAVPGHNSLMHDGELSASSESSPITNMQIHLGRHTSDSFREGQRHKSGQVRGRDTDLATTPMDEESMLTAVFFQTSTHLFSIYTGSCNPFMRLRQYLPHSKALRYAIQAMAALTISDYYSADKTRHMDRGLELQRLAYRELSTVLADPMSSLSDATFAAVVHIGMTEPWHSLRSDQSGAMHLRTSKVLICQRQQAKVPLPPKYLCNLLLYWDLLVSLHSDSSHEGYTTDMLLHGVHSEDEPIDYIDPTLGVGVHLCQIIVDMENFLRFWRTHQSHRGSNDMHHLEIALAIERRLKDWQPEIEASKLIGCVGVFETSPLQDILFTAEAYRQAALLLLYRSMPGVLHYGRQSSPPSSVSSNEALQDLASSVLALLTAIPVTSPVCTTHEWILVVTSADVATKEGRDFVRERMSGLLDKIGIIGIKEVMNYIEEVWSMIDRGEGDSGMWMEGMHRRNWYPLLG